MQAGRASVRPIALGSRVCCFTAGRRCTGPSSLNPRLRAYFFPFPFLTRSLAPLLPHPPAGAQLGGTAGRLLCLAAAAAPAAARRTRGQREQPAGAAARHGGRQCDEPRVARAGGGAPEAAAVGAGGGDEPEAARRRRRASHGCVSCRHACPERPAWLGGGACRAGPWHRRCKDQDGWAAAGGGRLCGVAAALFVARRMLPRLWHVAPQHSCGIYPFSYTTAHCPPHDRPIRGAELPRWRDPMAPRVAQALRALPCACRHARHQGTIQTVPCPLCWVPLAHCHPFPQPHPPGVLCCSRAVPGWLQQLNAVGATPGTPS